MDEFLKDIIQVDEAPQNIDEVAAAYWFEEVFHMAIVSNQ